MTHDNFSLGDLSDRELVAEITRLARCERTATARLIASLVELDARKLYLGEGCSSLFIYCTEVLRLSEGAAYGRIQAARAARHFPLILALLEDGALNLTTVGLLAPHLTEENHIEVLEAARHKSKRDVERQVAALHPRPDTPSSVRKVPARSPHQPAFADDVVQSRSTAMSATPCRPLRSTVVAPLAPERYRITVTVSQETHDKLRRVQDLLRHVIPNGDPAAIFEKAVTALLADLTRRKLAETCRPRRAKNTAAGSRTIPAAVRREVWARDGGQCTYVGPNGRCSATGLLEFHHVLPFAAGGSADVDNIQLRCAAHNRYEAQQYFDPGQPWLSRERRGSGASTPPQ
jgi:5-methylcytosine-specific restriction endonuclease McrA